MKSFRDHLIIDTIEDRVGSHIRLAGWVARHRDHGGVLFVDLRDHTGTIQLVARDSQMIDSLSEIRDESCVSVFGKLMRRPMVSSDGSAGLALFEIEVVEVQVLGQSDVVPFRPNEKDVNEELRLRYRYLDMRGDLGSRLRQRAEIVRIYRETMQSVGSVEVETPTMTKSTPEGARDFLVPARLKPGNFYALPQSPQLFKQLLMTGGLDRYHQVARCYRDEDFRADRQPEFTQLDAEFSFVDRDEVLSITERFVAGVWKSLLGIDLSAPLRRMPYAEAMAKYGTDKPDLRFDLPIHALAAQLDQTDFEPLRGVFVAGVRVPGGAAMSRKDLDRWSAWLTQRGGKALFSLTLIAGEFGGTIGRKISREEAESVFREVEASDGDAIFICAGEERRVLTALGALRGEIGRQFDLYEPGAWSLLWIVDAPMFELSEWAEAGGDVAVGSGKWTAVHHAFTAPKAEWVGRFTDSPGEALSDSYDLVCNGQEIGGGSIRINSYQTQLAALEVMGISSEAAQQKFGFLLDALRLGTPPHGGIALGLDRLAALVAGATSIRDVIAFPKSGGGSDPLTGAPDRVDEAQLSALEIQLTGKAKEA